MKVKKIQMLVGAAGETANYPAGSIYEVGKGIPANLADAFVNAQYAKVIEEVEIAKEPETPQKAAGKGKKKAADEEEVAPEAAEIPEPKK